MFPGDESVGRGVLTRSKLQRRGIRRPCSPDVPREVLAAAEDHATFAKAATLEGLCGHRPTPFGTRCPRLRWVLELLLLLLLLAVIGVEVAVVELLLVGVGAWRVLVLVHGLARWALGAEGGVCVPSA